MKGFISLIVKSTRIVSTNKKFYWLYRILISVLHFWRRITKTGQHRRRFPIHYLTHKNIIGTPVFVCGRYSIYAQYYTHGSVISPGNDEQMSSVKTELFYCNGVLHSKEYEEFESDVLLPISIVNDNRKSLVKARETSEIEIIRNKKNFKLKQLRDNTFYHIRFSKGDRVSIHSKEKVLCGKPLKLTKGDKKLVLVLFLDALGANIINLNNIENIIPNTFNFFKKGYINLNCYSNAEYTIPSLSSMSTGRYVYKNNFFHPNSYKEIGGKNKIISEYFQESGYFTQLISNNTGQNPSYGYCKGFDRTIYGVKMKQEEVVSEFIDSMRVFGDRKVFSWLTFIDIHHKYNDVARFSAGADMSLEAHADNKLHVQKTVSMKNSEHFTEWYFNEIKRFDYHLKFLYDYIEENYKNNEILVSLVSDHAQSFVDKGESVMRRDKLNVPFMLRGKGVVKKQDSHIMENVDILPILLDKCGINYESSKVDGNSPVCLGGRGKEYVFSESIYPGRTYKAVIRNKHEECFIESTNLVNHKNGVDEHNRKKLKFKVVNQQSTEAKSDILEKYKKMYKENFSRKK